MRALCFQFVIDGKSRNLKTCLLFSRISMENSSTDMSRFSFNIKFVCAGLIQFYFSWADFLCCLGPDLPQQTSEPLHHRRPEGDAAEILRLALYVQHGTSPTDFVLFDTLSLTCFLSSSLPL